MAMVMRTIDWPVPMKVRDQPSVNTRATRASAFVARSQARAASPPMLWQTSTGGRPVAAVTRRKIVVFPYAGGSPHAFRDWGPLLEPQYELWALQLPGRASRFLESCLNDMDAVVDAVMTELPALVAGADFSFHSNGALVAYACTQRLERLGARLPRHVFLSGKKPPNGPPRRDSELPDPELVRFLTDLGGMPQEVVANDELIELCLPIIRADLKVGESFRPHGRLRWLHGPADREACATQASTFTALCAVSGRAGRTC